MDDHTATYTQGYMIGVCLCRCGSKAVAACSGKPTPGFERAVSECGLELVDDMPELSAQQERTIATVGRGTWNCAAPKLIKGLDGHKPRTIVEMFYQRIWSVSIIYNYVSRRGPTRTLTLADNFPRREGVSIQYRRTEHGETTFTRETFGTGDTAPSCDRCKINLPEMLCDADELCP